MWPRSKTGVVKYRNQLRRRECRLALERVLERFPHLRVTADGRRPCILEFGSGGGHQVPVLQTFGDVIATDIYVSPQLQVGELGSPFILMDISRSPFPEHTFEIIFSNHVLEHVRELDRALKEVQRIGTEDCVFAFSVPTPLWLFLCMPAKYLDRTKRAVSKVWRCLTGTGSRSGKPGAPATVYESQERSRGWRNILLPHGHGEYPGFRQALRAFRESAWRERFARHGLRVVECRRLLLYATARWPFIPANTLLPRIGLASSRLFILQSAPAPKATSPKPQVKAAACPV